MYLCTPSHFETLKMPKETMYAMQVDLMAQMASRKAVYESRIKLISEMDGKLKPGRLSETSACVCLSPSAFLPLLSSSPILPLFLPLRTTLLALRHPLSRPYLVRLPFLPRCLRSLTCFLRYLSSLGFPVRYFFRLPSSLSLLPFPNLAFR